MEYSFYEMCIRDRTGDTQVFCRAASYNANVSAFFEKWMRDMRDGQRSDGAYPDVAPHSWVGYGQAAWADAGIIVPWTIYLMYDNKKILQDNYASMEKYMEFLSHQKGDGYNYNGAGTNYGDWLSYEDTERRFVSVCYYAYTAQLMAKISEALKTDDCDAYAAKAKAYRNLAQEIKEEFQTRYVDADGDLKQKSQTAYLLALKQDLFPTEEARKKGLETLTRKIAGNGNRLSTGFVEMCIRDRDNRVKSVYTIEHRPFYRYSDHRQRSIGCNYTGKGGSHSGSSNDYFNATATGILGKLFHSLRRAVSRKGVHFERYMHCLLYTSYIRYAYLHQQ